MTSIVESSSLFEIDTELDDLLEQIEEQVETEGEPSEELLSRFRQFCHAHGEKVDRIGRFVRMMEAREQYCRAEARQDTAPRKTKRRTTMKTMKRMRDRVLSNWQRWTNFRKAEDTVVNDVCPRCGAKAHASRTTARDIAVAILCSVLLLAIAVPAVWATEQWMERQSQRVLDRMMIWREPIESWNQ